MTVTLFHFSRMSVKKAGTGLSIKPDGSMTKSLLLNVGEELYNVVLTDDSFYAKDFKNCRKLNLSDEVYKAIRDWLKTDTEGKMFCPPNLK